MSTLIPGFDYIYKEDTDYLDGLSLVSDILAYYTPVNDDWYNLEHSGYKDDLFKASKKAKKLKKDYDFVACIPLGRNKGCFCILCIDPNNKYKTDKCPFIKLDFNPSKLERRHYKRLKRRLASIFGRTLARTILDISVITRYDYTIDKPGITADMHAFHASKKWISSVIGSTENGISVYLGRSKGKNATNYFRIYDKIKEQIIKRKRYMSPYDNILRIEYSHNPGILLKDYYLEEYPMRSLKCYEIFYDDVTFDEDFIRDCNKYGVPVAMHNVPYEETKRMYRRYLKKYEIDLIDHDEHEKRFNNLIRELMDNLL